MHPFGWRFPVCHDRERVGPSPGVVHAGNELAALHLAAIVEWSDDAIVSMDLDGTITSWNRAAERMFGYTAEEAIGRSIMLIIPIDRHDEERDVLSRIRAGVSVDHFETVRIRKDGTPVDVSITVSPMRACTSTRPSIVSGFASSGTAASVP